MRRSQLHLPGALLVFGAGLASQETQPEVPEEAATEEAAGELEEAERLSEQEKRKLLTGGRSHAELMDDAIRAIAQGDWGSALHASTVGLLLEEYLDELQLAEAYYLQGFQLRYILKEKSSNRNQEN